MKPTKRIVKDRERIEQDDLAGGWGMTHEIVTSEPRSAGGIAVSQQTGLRFSPRDPGPPDPEGDGPNYAADDE